MTNVKPGHQVLLSETMHYSEGGAKWMRGSTVRVLEVDEGEEWEPDIAKVRISGHHGCVGPYEDIWINKKDIVRIVK